MRKWVLGGCLCVASTSNNPCDEAVAAAKVIDVDAAQKQLLARAQANGEASKGEYVPGSQPSDEESLFVKNYVY